jgi:hypothetical protein
MVSLKLRFGWQMLRRFCESFRWCLTYNDARTYNEARISTFLLYFKGDLGHN